MRGASIASANPERSERVMHQPVGVVQTTSEARRMRQKVKSFWRANPERSERVSH
jgi:hypothetical protein